MDHPGGSSKTHISTDLVGDAFNDSLLLWFLRREGLLKWEGYDRAMKKYLDFLKDEVDSND